MVSHPHSTLPQPLAAPNLFSVSRDSPLLDISYKWDRMIRGLSSRASFTQHKVLQA